MVIEVGPVLAGLLTSVGHGLLAALVVGVVLAVMAIVKWEG